MSVSVDTARFVPTPFSWDDDAFHVCFAGRLDDFKDPPLMLATLAHLSERLAAAPVGRFRRVVFDYVGATDPTRFAESAAVEGLTRPPWHPQGGRGRGDHAARSRRDHHLVFSKACPATCSRCWPPAGPSGAIGVCRNSRT